MGAQLDLLVKESLHHQDYYTTALVDIAKQGHSVGYINVDDYLWSEIDIEEEYKQLLKQGSAVYYQRRGPDT